MEKPNEEKNTFAEMEGNKNNSKEEEVKSEQPIKKSEEINVSDFSDTAIGDKVKYVRPNLDGTEDVIDKFQVFPADTDKEPKLTENKENEYWVPTMILYWKSKNSDGVQNKEYISGAKVWKNRDGNTSDEIAFWYEGGDQNLNQSCILWEKVAQCLEVEPKELSPRQFIAFLNSKPKFKIAKQETKNHKGKPGQPKFVYKNMPGEYLKA